MSDFYNNAIFWIETEKIKPNPLQPRKEFDEDKLKDLAESVRMYGILQPLIVTRREIVREDGGLSVEYELISGERRLRASKIASLSQVPALIRSSEESDKMKLELAIIENLQREDLNPVDRARAFQRLIEDFNFKHVDIAGRIGKSREFVSNSVRILGLPVHMIDALSAGEMTEGHTRPLLMLIERPQEQETLFREIRMKRLSVRETENIARRIAVERTRKKDLLDPEINEIEKTLAEKLGTRVIIERRENGGKIHIDFFSNEDLKNLFRLINVEKITPVTVQSIPLTTPAPVQEKPVVEAVIVEIVEAKEPEPPPPPEEADDLYSIKNFSV